MKNRLSVVLCNGELDITSISLPSFKTNGQNLLYLAIYEEIRTDRDNLCVGSLQLARIGSSSVCIKYVMKLQRKDTNKYGAHSPRGTTPSQPLNRGINVVIFAIAI